MKTIMWFREDLRLKDNRALHHAVIRGEVLPLFIYPEGLGGASYWWLHQSLLALSDELSKHGADLVLKTGSAEQILLEICEQEECDAVVWNRVYSPQGIEQGQAVKTALKEVAETQSFSGQLLIEPSKVFTKQGTPFKVFTPFWRHCVAGLEPGYVLAAPSIVGAEHSIDSDALDEWDMQPSKPDWSEGLAQRWKPGEGGAQARWQEFLDGTIERYKEGRDFPAQHNTSYLSPHLAFGEVSPRQIWADTHEAIANQDIDEKNGLKFLSEIGWREFSRYLLFHFPQIANQPFNKKFLEFPWQNNANLLKKWQKGLTGYPIVDAGMRELWHTGYMHNRVRMVVGSFLTKHCLTHWQEGMDWFWDTLVDADLANNTASWQWISGCGADAAPYFRIFNPILQGEKFDKQGTYIKRWLPELSDVPTKFIHKPWEADREILRDAGVTLGETYPRPVVDHKQARAMALDAYKAIKTPPS